MSSKINNINNIIVVGGNAAGPSAAAKAKRVNPNVRVMMFEASNFISTGTCEIPYVLSGKIKDYKKIIFFDEKSFFQKKGVKVYTHHLVQKIDRKNKTIDVINLKTNDKNRYNYDRLILTTGSVAKKIPAIPVNTLNAFTLKSVNDYLNIENYLKKNEVKNVIVIGAGYIGLETAEVFKKLGMDVTIIETAPLPMPNADMEISRLILNIIQNNGIEFKGPVKNISFVIRENKITNVKADDEFLESDLIITAIGVTPNIKLALSAGLEIGSFGGIKVDNKLRTSDPFIFAAGDNIEVISAITGRPDYMPFATIAHEYGHIAGANAAGDNKVAKPVIKNSAVKLFDNVLALVGLNYNEAEKSKKNISVVNAVAYNLIHVMPESQKVFGKIIFDKNDLSLLGASFIGGGEVTGYADFISMMIRSKIKAGTLTDVNFNYTPPQSPFINILSILGRKIKEEFK